MSSSRQNLHWSYVKGKSGYRNGCQERPTNQSTEKHLKTRHICGRTCTNCKFLTARWIVSKLLKRQRKTLPFPNLVFPDSEPALFSSTAPKVRWSMYVVRGRRIFFSETPRIPYRPLSCLVSERVWCFWPSMHLEPKQCNRQKGRVKFTFRLFVARFEDSSTN